MLHVKMVYVKRVRIRNEVRRYRLISLRKCSPPWVMFRIHHVSLYRCTTFDVIMVTLSMVSVSRRAKRRAISHKSFHLPHWKRLTLDTICLTLSRQLYGVNITGINCETTSTFCVEQIFQESKWSWPCDHVITSTRLPGREWMFSKIVRSLRTVLVRIMFCRGDVFQWT